jgi:ABC-2 type transport system permease protein/sodium transport system permease protein
MLALALMFPSYFVLANGLAHSEEIGLDQRLVVAGLITAIVFGGIPLAIGIFGRVEWASGFGLRKPRVATVIAAGLLGLTLWPFAHEIYLLSIELGISTLGSEQIERAKTLLGELQGLPLGLVLLTLALVPGVLEELCFRGFLFSSLRQVLTGWQTILVTALLFGVFHEVLGPGRLVPSASLGLVLGWLRLRTGSVFPPMLLHVLHNGFLLSISYWREALESRGWGVAERAHLPAMWLTAAVVGVAIAGAILVASTRRRTLVAGGGQAA